MGSLILWKLSKSSPAGTRAREIITGRHEKTAQVPTTLGYSGFGLSLRRRVNSRIRSSLLHPSRTRNQAAARARRTRKKEINPVQP